MDYRSLWAKSDPYHPLWCHLLDVAAVCEALLPRFGGVDPLPTEWLLYLVALHDIGKADAQFQVKIEDQTRIQALRDAGYWFPLNQEAFRHEARSAKWLRVSLDTHKNWELNARNVVAQATTGHHGDFSAIAYNEVPAHSEKWVQVRQEINVILHEVFHLGPLSLKQFPDASAAGMKLSGLIVLSDWIASNHETYRYNRPERLPANAKPITYWQAARAEASEAVRRLELDVRHSPPLSKPGFREVWPEYHPRGAQQVLEERIQSEGIPLGLVILEAPMGEGKTEAALYLAASWNRAGAFIALPTQATSNQMHQRYLEFLRARDPGGPPPRLVHGMAWLLDDIAPERETDTEDAEERRLSREWFQNAKRALLAPDGVGTVDQALMAALNVKHGFLRFLGLSNKVLIIDEVHAYDLYMTTLMKRLLSWCRTLRVPVILLSATLSREQKQTLMEAYGGSASLLKPPDGQQEPYPLLTFVPLDETPFTLPVPSSADSERKIIVRRHPSLLADPEATARLALSSIEQGGCACILANTVRSAQEIFLALKEINPAETELLLFHARFRAEQRLKMEKKVAKLFGKGNSDGVNTNRPPRAILVATQVVEQSLDVDFDVMLSQIAPIDLLLQRCGRLHRHAKNDPRPTGQDAVLHVLLPPAGEYEFGSIEIKKSGKEKWLGVYDRETLLRTLALVQNRDAFHLPADFRLLIETCYGSERIPGEEIPAELLMAAAALKQERRAKSEQNAKTHLIPKPSPRVFAYGQPQDSPVAEGEDGERASYFRAQTREGDDSRNVLILHDPVLVALIRRGWADKEYWPGKKNLKQIFLQKASLPSWWFARVTPADGFELISDGPKWLRHHLILPMQDGEWHGVDGSGATIIIRDEEMLGLTWTKKTGQEQSI